MTARAISTPREDVARWNRDNDVRDAVMYRRDDGSTVFTRTRTPAAVLGSHTAVIWLDGVAGCVALSRVTSTRERVV